MFLGAGNREAEVCALVQKVEGQWASPTTVSFHPISPNLFFRLKKQTNKNQNSRAVPLVIVNYSEIGGLLREGADQVVGSSPEIMNSHSHLPLGLGALPGSY